MYNITIFAFNEEKNIAASIQSVMENSDSELAKFFVIANGCTDNTVNYALKEKARSKFGKMQVIEIAVGDKCNAWNKYVHELSDDVETHFFCDADVYFSDSCFSRMHGILEKSPETTVLVAGMPLAGRNVDYYRSLIVERACFFGNLYGVKGLFVEKMKNQNFRLPIGLNWIDSTLTKAVNTDLQFTNDNIPNRTTWVEECGYSFNSLSLFKPDDISLYLNRIGRYELGKLQEVFLEKIHFSNWPANLGEINKTIWLDFDKRTTQLSLFKKILVKKRLKKLLYR